jgi:hypothetical protein
VNSDSMSTHGSTSHLAGLQQPAAICGSTWITLGLLFWLPCEQELGCQALPSYQLRGSSVLVIVPVYIMT